MVMDSLRYWVSSFHVDGFRFDLCATLGREPHGFDPGAGFFDALRQDPVLAGVKLIAEPWDIGPGGYQLGNHPPGFRRMERPVPRRRAALLARRSRSAAGDRRAARRFGRSIRAAWSAPVGVGQLRRLA